MGSNWVIRRRTEQLVFLRICVCCMVGFMGSKASLRRKPSSRRSSRSSNIVPFIKQQLELHIMSAQNLKPMTCCCFMSTQAYAVAWIDLQDKKFFTPVDQRGGRNPSWNSILTLWIDEELLQNPMAGVTIEIYHCGWFCDKLVGTVRILLSDLVKDVKDSSGTAGRCFSYMVLRPSGRRQGLLNVGIAPEKLREEHEASSKEAAPAARNNSLKELQHGS